MNPEPFLEWQHFVGVGQMNVYVRDINYSHFSPLISPAFVNHTISIYEPFNSTIIITENSK